VATTKPVRMARRQACSMDEIRQWAKTEELPLPFDLHDAHPCRFTFFEGEANDWLYLAIHLIALDGYGYSLFCERLAQVYAALAAGEEPARAKFGEINALLAEVERWNTSKEADVARQYWMAALSKASEPVAVAGNDDPLTRGYHQLEV